MPWYKTPVQPFDPVIKDLSASPPEQGIRYFRDNFDGDGQDSNTLPTAQNQQFWQQLTNIQPITQGVLSRRWGYNLFAQFGPPLPFSRMYSFQNNNTLQRQIVYCAPKSICVSAEVNPSIVQESASLVSTIPPRMVDSRNYAYFYTGTSADLKKWDGIITNNLTKWGIHAPDLTTISSTAGPLGGTVAVNEGGINTAWSAPSNALILDGLYAGAQVTSSAPLTQFLGISGFAFTIPSTATITGIQVDISGYFTPVSSPTPIYNIFLSKGASPTYGNVRNITVNNFPETFITAGGPGDLWGGNWTPADINSTSFGTSIQGSWVAGSGSPNLFINYVRITVFYTSLSSAVTVTPAGGGAINLTVGRTYYCVFQNSQSGHFSDLNTASASTGPLVNSVVNLSAIPVSPDSQVDSKVILATADGGDPSILYFVASIANSATTYQDTTTETILNLNQQYLFTDPFGNEFGVTFNDPPPNGTICIKHKGRLWMAQQQNLFFSKSVAELTLPNGFIAGKYEESWNPSNYFDISGGAETIQGLFSDGSIIYIGTQSHIRRIFGDSPNNFQQPEICHQDIGVLNHEVWQNVFLQGTPTGFMWLSPDFKVMGSDGNTYLDLGHPIQNILNTINPAAAQNCHAMFVQQGPYDLYILAIPTGSNTFCDTHCVFNMRSQQWVIWQPTDPSTSMLFNLTSTGTPQWLFATVFGGATNNVYQYTPLATQDRVGFLPTNFIATALSSWLHLGSPTTRKILDEIEITGDAGMLFSIDGASTQADFNSPNIVTFNSNLILSPFQTYKVYLAGKTSRYHYYQLEFESTSNTSPTLLQSYALRAQPWNTL